MVVRTRDFDAGKGKEEEKEKERKYVFFIPPPLNDQITQRFLFLTLRLEWNIT